jgi:hypothetical protein
MHFVKYYIIGIWLLPLLLVFTPGHDLAHQVNGWYVVIVCSLVLLATLPLNSRKVEIRAGPLRDRALQAIHLVAAAVLLAAAAAVFVQLLLGGGNLRENREEFEARFVGYNYVFVLLAYAVFMSALSRFAARPVVYLSRAAWLMLGCLMLLTGNRQFVFFSLVYLMFYRIGLSNQPGRTALKSIGLVVLAAIGAILFSIARLDYVQADEAGAVGRYLSTLTGASCTAAAWFCESAMETLFQLLYAYFGMQYSGIGYSIEYHDVKGGFPLLAVLAPVIHRRIESLLQSDAFDSHVEAFDQHVYVASGSEYSHFFVSTFGSVAQGSGILGMVIFGIAMFTVFQLASAWLRRSASEAVYMLLVFACTTMLVGFMQYPFSEPFIFFGLLPLSMHLIIALYGGLSKPAVALPAEQPTGAAR